jgi:hypothetical protein
MNRLTLRSVVAYLVCALSACNPIVFHPESIPERKGAVFGRFSITLDNEPRTSCKVLFVTPSGATSDVRVDATGWVFDSLWKGPNALSYVECAMGRGKLYAPLGNQLQFQVPGDGTIAYFGHVHIELNARLHPVLDAIRGVKQKPVELSVERDIDAAVGEYNSRFGPLAGTLKVVDGQRGASGPDLVEERSELDGLKLAWRGLPGSHPDTVVFGFLSEASVPQLADCQELTLVADGQVLHFKPEYSVTSGASPVKEIMQIQLDLPTLRVVVAAERVELKACRLERAFTTQAVATARIFAERFEERLHTPAP